MRGDQCKEICPDFHTFFVEEKRGKANLNKYINLKSIHRFQINL